MDQRLVGIGERLRPASLLEDLDAVGEVEVPACPALVQDPHHEPLHPPRARDLPVHEGLARQLGDEVGERSLDGREQLEQVRKARHRVVAGEELRKDVAAADGAREHDPVLRRRLGQRL